jgi:hypothetical protein
MTQARYLTCAETAKLIRAQLKKRFPKTKFSVVSKTYSGGASITVKWTDGPTAKLVESVTSAYAGGGFDGMIDMAYSVEAWLLPDGSATFAKTRGTAGSMGIVPSAQEMQPSFKAERVHFQADYVFCERKYSPGFYQRAADSVAKRYGVELATKVSDWGTPFLADQNARIGDQWASDVVYRELARRMPAMV